ncbi:MAG: phosphatidate cytidylyltransferase [Ilumatobacteraceae bacterium]
MSDDQWRSKRRRDDDFGPPLFGDPAEGADGGDLSFGDNTGPLPHWTAPASGELPRIVGTDRDGSGDVDVWSSFSGDAPVWSDDDSPDPSAGYEAVSENVRLGQMGDNSGGIERGYYEDPDPSGSPSGPVRREPGRITIGTDPTDEGVGRPGPKGRARGSREAQAAANRAGRPSGAVRTTPGNPASGLSGRDMPTAIAVGAVLGAAFVAAIKFGPLATLVVVVIVITLASFEFFEKVTEKGYQPASVVGIVACFAAPITAYNYGDGAVPLVFVFAFIAGCMSFIAAPSLNSSPMPNMAITTLGITWIGLAGAFGGLFLGNEAAGIWPTDAGTDTLLIIAIGVVVNDIGALFVGSGIGKTPLRGWISPNKSVEGFIGGTVFTIVAMFVINILDKSANWNGVNLILLGVVIAIAAPLGDLTESMFKRNLDIKDFGSIVKGHGGVLDRFDGFLFTLPMAYYLTLVLEPWVPAFIEFNK